MNRVKLNEIVQKYQTIIAWGTGLTFQMNYRKEYFHIDVLIDGRGKMCGGNYQGIEIKSETALDVINGKGLVIIYSIYEREIMEQIQRHSCDVDVIIYSLLDITLPNGRSIVELNAKNCEDALLVMLARKLMLDNVSYLEIGVCHPILRNNTFLLYENYSLGESLGVLVEANPLCWDLIQEYRSKDKLLKMGVGKEKGKQTFYIFHDSIGNSTFVKEFAERIKAGGHPYQKIEIDVENVNTIIQQNFDITPDFLSIDAEGMDYDILLDWDYCKYPFKGVICEIMEENEGKIYELMMHRGYRIYARTLENIIWVRNDLEIFG